MKALWYEPLMRHRDGLPGPAQSPLVGFSGPECTETTKPVQNRDEISRYAVRLNLSDKIPLRGFKESIFDSR